MKFLRMFLFYRFKLLKQSSVLFNVQYRMINVIEIIISKLFYVNRIINDVKTKTSIRTLMQNLIQYFQIIYKIINSLLLFQMNETIFKNSIRFLYNIINAFVILNLMMNMIIKKIVKFSDIFILFVYRAQFKLYRQTIKNMNLFHFEMLNIQIRTMNFMQKNQTSLIIFDIVVCQRLDFMRLKNKMNVTCSRIMKKMIIVANVKQMMNERYNVRQHFDNVINHIKRLREFATIINTVFNAFFSRSFIRENMTDHMNVKKTIYENVEKSNFEKINNDETVENWNQ